MGLTLESYNALTLGTGTNIACVTVVCIDWYVSSFGQMISASVMGACAKGSPVSSPVC